MNQNDLYNKVVDVEKTLRQVAKSIDSTVQEKLKSKSDEEICQLKAVAAGGVLLISSLPLRKKHPVLSGMVLLGGTLLLACEAKKALETKECTCCNTK